MSILRKDPVSNGWVILAEERSIPADDLRSPPVQSNSRAACPFCEGREGMTPPEIRAIRPDRSRPNGPGWTVRAIPNRSAALRIEGAIERSGDGMYDWMQGVGAHEVIIETPDHDARMGDYTQEQMAALVRMYRERADDLHRDQRFRYIQIFKNHGKSAGARQSHPHSQVVALPISPRWVKEELESCKRHWQLKERCLFCDIMRQELDQEKRIVFQNNDFLAFTPYASKFPFETWILPKRHAHEFRALRDEQIDPLAQTMRATLGALKHALDDPPYNFIIHSAPRITPERYPQWSITIDQDYHWHIEIIPRTIRMAGFEWGTGFYINPTLPENAAGYLRKMLSDRK